jgi:hypothetical protein
VGNVKWIGYCSWESAQAHFCLSAGLCPISYRRVTWR